MRNAMSVLRSALLLAVAPLVEAGVLTPVLDPDGVAVAPSAPGLGARVMVPLSGAFSLNVWFEDLNALLAGTTGGLPGDADYNDMVVQVAGTAGGAVSVRLLAQVTAMRGSVVLFYGASVVSANSTGPVLLPVLATPGQELALEFLSEQGYLFSTGFGSRNPDLLPHAIVQSAIPEPWSAPLAGGGLLVIGWLWRTRRFAGVAVSLTGWLRRVWRRAPAS